MGSTVVLTAKIMQHVTLLFFRQNDGHRSGKPDQPHCSQQGLSSMVGKRTPVSVSPILERNKERGTRRRLKIHYYQWVVYKGGNPQFLHFSKALLTSEVHCIQQNASEDPNQCMDIHVLYRPNCTPSIRSYLLFKIIPLLTALRPTYLPFHISITDYGQHNEVCSIHAYKLLLCFTLPTDGDFSAEALNIHVFKSWTSRWRGNMLNS